VKAVSVLGQRERLICPTPLGSDADIFERDSKPRERPVSSGGTAFPSFPPPFLASYAICVLLQVLLGIRVGVRSVMG